MFSKTLIFVLLGCSLVLASPVESHEKRINRGILKTFSEWLYKADEAINGVYDRVKSSVKSVYDSVIGTGAGVVDYGREKVNQVLQKYYELKAKSEASLNQVKNTFLTKVINELQNVIDTLGNATDGETFEKLKEKTKELAESSKEALEKLQQQLQEAINAEKKKLEQDLHKWEKEANSIVSEKY